MPHIKIFTNTLQPEYLYKLTRKQIPCSSVGILLNKYEDRLQTLLGTHFERKFGLNKECLTAYILAFEIETQIFLLQTTAIISKRVSIKSQ